MTKTRVIVEPAREVIAHCALGHKWPTTLQIERDTHLTKNQGKRGFFKFHSIYAIDRCPECGHQQMGCSLPVEHVRLEDIMTTQAPESKHLCYQSWLDFQMAAFVSIERKANTLEPEFDRINHGPYQHPVE